MPLVCLLVVLGGWLLPAPAQAQAWAEAYRAEDYQRTADLLHPILFESMGPEAYDDDPSPTRYLAILYAQGLGVARDPIAACALAQTSGMAAQMSSRRYANDVRRWEAVVAESERFTADICGALSDEDRLTASTSIGCFALGMPEQILTVGPHAVRIGHRGIGLVGVDADKLAPLSCSLAIVHIRTRTLRPPEDAAPRVKARHFIELFSWHVGRTPTDHALAYFLHWQPYEVSESGIGWGGMVEVTSVGRWPGLGLPAGLARVPVMEMIRSGHVRWRIDGDPPRRGWFMGPDKGVQ